MARADCAEGLVSSKTLGIGGEQMPWKPYGTRFASHIVRLLMAIVLGLTLGMPAPVIAQSPIPSAAVTEAPVGEADLDLYAGVLPSERDAIYAQTAGDLSQYRIRATLIPATDDEPYRITGDLTLLYINQTSQPAEAVYFRLYSNDPRYAEGELRMSQVTVDGAPTAPILSVDDTVAEVALPRVVQPGERVEITAAFEAVVPTNPVESYGMFSWSPEVGTLTLAHWYPMLAGYDAEHGWNLLPVTRNSDPIYSNTALYDVEISAPADLRIATSGVAVTTSDGDGLRTTRFSTGPSRDFAVVADDNYEVVSQEFNGTTINSWYDPDHRTGGEAALRYAVQAMEIFSERFGAYPFAEFDIVDVSIQNGAAGIEFPQLIHVGGDYYQLPEILRGEANFLENVVAHEVIHQWFFALVGNNHYYHAFMDEGLTNALTVTYFGEVYDADEEEYQFVLNLEMPYVSYLFSDGDVIVNTPSDEFDSESDYVTAVYSKAPIGFDAIQQIIGEEAFYQALAEYTTAFSFAVATPDDLFAAFQNHSDVDLTDVWHHWMEAAEVTADYTAADLDRLYLILVRG
jgi:hypothetical protein